MSKEYTREPKSKWCKPCKKTKRGIIVDDAFMCVDCATEAGYTVVSIQGVGGKVFTSKTGREERKKQLNDVDAMHRANQARRVKAKAKAKKAKEMRKIALMEDMVGIQGLENHFKKSGLCRGCMGRVPVAQATYVHRDDFRNPNNTPTVLCRGCIE